MRARWKRLPIFAVWVSLLCGGCAEDGGDRAAPTPPPSAATSAPTPTAAGSDPTTPAPSQPSKQRNKGPVAQDLLACQNTGKVAQALDQDNFEKVEQEVENLKASAERIRNARLKRSIAAFIEAFDRGDAEKTASTFSAVFEACGSLL